MVQNESEDDDIKQSSVYHTREKINEEKVNLILSEISSRWHINWLDKCSIEFLGFPLSQQLTWEVKETGLISAVRRQNSWIHKYPSFGSIYKQINVYFYRSKQA